MIVLRVTQISKLGSEFRKLFVLRREKIFLSGEFKLTMLTPILVPSMTIDIHYLYTFEALHGKLTNKGVPAFESRCSEHGSHNASSESRIVVSASLAHSRNQRDAVSNLITLHYSEHPYFNPKLKGPNTLFHACSNAQIVASYYGKGLREPHRVLSVPVRKNFQGQTFSTCPTFLFICQNKGGSSTHFREICN